MPRELGVPQFPIKEASKGDQLVAMGEYVGITESKFGNNYNFIQLEDGGHIVLSGGALKWRVESGHMSEGDVFDIFYEGKETMEKGDYKGKDVHTFKILQYGPDEIPKDLRKVMKRPGGSGNPSAGVARPQNGAESIPGGPDAPAAVEPSESLDELE